MRFTSIALVLCLGACHDEPQPILVQPDAKLAPVGVKAPTPATACSAPNFEVHFSPKGECTDSIVKFIGSATRSVRVQAYSFTSEPIAKALVDAKAKGRDVAVLLDNSDLTERGGQLQTLVTGNVTTLLDGKHAIAHNKVIIVDDKDIETGSFNYSAAAEKSNAENCIFIRDQKELAAMYSDNWGLHREHSTAPPPKAPKR